MKRGVLAIAAAAWVGCGELRYLEATDAFATAALAGTEALAPAPAAAAALCRRRAQLALLLRRADGTEPWGAEPSWSAWGAAHPVAPGGRSWTEHCAELDRAAPIVDRALTLLAAYARALHTLARGSDYTGCDLTDAAKSAGALAGQLHADGAAAALKAVADPLKGVASFLLSDYAARRLVRAVPRGDDDVQSLLRALGAFIAAVADEAADARAKQAQLVDTLEAQLAASPRDPDGPGRALGFYAFARGADDDQRDVEQRLANYQRLLHELATAHAKLRSGAGAASAAERADQLKQALGAIEVVLTVVSALAPSQKRGTP